jgi:hypothetical protein
MLRIEPVHRRHERVILRQRNVARGRDVRVRLSLSRLYIDDFHISARGPSFTFRNTNSFVLGTSNSVKFSEGDPMKIKSLFFASSSENKLPRFTRSDW